jgi:hypothetical protein
MPTGKLKWFSVSKGFGFITPGGQSTDVGKRNRASVFHRFPERKGVCRRANDHFQAKGTSA